MKYRPCLWCGDWFWSSGTQKCCCPEHQEARNREKTKKSHAKTRERRRKIKAQLMAELAKKGKA